MGFPDAPMGASGQQCRDAGSEALWASVGWRRVGERAPDSARLSSMHASARGPTHWGGGGVRGSVSTATAQPPPIAWCTVCSVRQRGRGIRDGPSRDASAPGIRGRNGQRADCRWKSTLGRLNSRSGNREMGRGGLGFCGDVPHPWRWNTATRNERRRRRKAALKSPSHPAGDG